MRFHENQSDVDRNRSLLITGLQEFASDGQTTIGFVYKLKQNSPWTQYFTENNQLYTIKQHTDYFTWGEMMGLTLMYLGRFFSILPLDKAFTQSVFGRNIRTHQPFDDTTC